ncbi:glycoside hydrolase [Meredithblackwellia eburnea MCA 4105]
MLLSLTFLTTLQAVSVLATSLPEPAPRMHQMVKRGISSPSKSGIGQWWETWLPQTSDQINWTGTDFASFFTTVTTANGLDGGGVSDATIHQFVTNAHSISKKAVMTIGGWGGSVYFSSLIATSASRQSFATVISTWMTQFSFDAVEFDWEFPAQIGNGNQYSSMDAINFALFFYVLRNTIGKAKGILLTVNVGGIRGLDGKKLADMSYIAKRIDYLVIMGYDFNAQGWSATTGPNSPLTTCTSTSSTIDVSVNYFVSTGIPACKIIMGLPAYSHQFTTASSTLINTQYTLNGKKTYSMMFQKFVQGTDNMYTYKQLIANGFISSDASTGGQGFTRYWDNCTSTPFIFRPSDKTFISYDDPTSIKLKAQYAKSKGLAGLFFFAASGVTTDLLTAAKTGFSS